MIDAALVSEAVAVAVDPRAGTTIAIVTKAVVPSCPALSRISDDTWITTIGGGTIAKPKSSVRDDARWARAKPYLERDPIAIAFDGERAHVIAVAQPSPVHAWLTIDAADIAGVERDVRAFIDRWRAPSTITLTTKVQVSRKDHQLLVRADNLADEELATIMTDLLRVGDAAVPPASTATFVCPPSGNGVTKCVDGTRYTVTSLADALRALASAEALPVISGGDVIGIQLTEDAELVLRRGDIILGLDAQRVASVAQLRELARHATHRASLAIRRAGTDVVIELTE